jgi:hypothetical protein
MFRQKCMILSRNHENCLLYLTRSAFQSSRPSQNIPAERLIWIPWMLRYETIQRLLYCYHIFSQVVEHDRQRLLAVERLLLETVCFNFTSRMPFPYVIKIGRALGGGCYTPIFHFPAFISLPATKKLTKLSWRLAIDWYD